MGIYATLHTHPTCKATHKIPCITRGATAELIYPLDNKVFNFEDIEQITFTFKQGKNLYWYSMFSTTKNTEGKDETSIDSHFYHLDTSEQSAIVFNLNDEETKQFKAGVPVEYEIAIELNKSAGSLVSLSGKDSIIIEPQHCLEVRDSLYSLV